VLVGPAMLRVDLRQDLAHLAAIKTWPVGGAAVFRGELLAPLIALSLGAALPILLGSALDDRMMLEAGAPAALRARFALSALLVASTLVLAHLVIHNGIAVTFPAWVRLRPGGGAGGVVPRRGLMGRAAAPRRRLRLFVECAAATELFGRILDRADLQDVAIVE